MQVGDVFACPWVTVEHPVDRPHRHATGAASSFRSQRAWSRACPVAWLVCGSESGVVRYCPPLLWSSLATSVALAADVWGAC